MATETTTMGAKPNGFKTMIDTIIAPGEAFAALRMRPTWVIAAISLVVCFLIGYFLMRDAAQHAGVESVKHMIAPGGFMANSSDLAKQQALENAQHPPSWQIYVNLFFGILAILVGVVFNTLFLWMASAIGKGDRGFGTLWAASMNNAFASQGLAQIVMGVIAKLRGADSFNSTLDLYRAMPGLGMLHMSGYFGAFLTFFTIFTIWGLILNVLILRTTARANGPITWVIPIVITLLGAAFTGIFGLFG